MKLTKPILAARWENKTGKLWLDLYYEPVGAKKLWYITMHNSGKRIGYVEDADKVYSAVAKIARDHKPALKEVTLKP